LTPLELASFVRVPGSRTERGIEGPVASLSAAIVVSSFEVDVTAEAEFDLVVGGGGKAEPFERDETLEAMLTG